MTLPEAIGLTKTPAPIQTLVRENATSTGNLVTSPDAAKLYVMFIPVKKPKPKMQANSHAKAQKIF